MNSPRAIRWAATLLVALGLSTTVARGQLPGPSNTAVRDRAGMFSPGAVAKAELVLRGAERSSGSHWETVIETRPSLANRDIALAAVAEAEKAGVHGIFVLIARAEKKVHVSPGDASQDVFSASRCARIVEAFTRGFKANAFDAGLLDAAAEIRRVALGYGVRDDARLFSPEAVAKADAELERIRESTGRQVVVATVPSLEGRSPQTVAAEAAKRADVHGLYVLIAAKERETWLEPIGPAREVFTRDRNQAVNNVLIQAFKARAFDRGLGDAVALIARDAASGPLAARPKTKTDLIPSAPVNPLRKGRLRSAGTNSNRLAPTDSITPVGAAPSPMPIPPPSPSHATSPSPAVAPPANPAGSEGGSIVPLLVGGGVVVGLLWVVARVFRRGASPALASMGRPPQPQPHPQPDHGDVPPHAPAPGYGYGPPPAPAGGGGAGGWFLSGALGGLGGAIVGNAIYDRLARPHDAPAEMPTPPARSALTPSEPGWSHPSPAAPPPVEESFDPAAGAGGSWSDDAPAETTTEAVGGTWDAPDDNAGAGGDWSGGDSGADPTEDPDQGGDWSGGDSGADPTDDSDQGGW